MEVSKSDSVDIITVMAMDLTALHWNGFSVGNCSIGITEWKILRVHLSKAFS